MTHRAEIRNGVCFLRLEGEVDRANVDGIRAEIQSCLTKSAYLVLDFAAVSYANGAVLSLLRDTLGRLPSKGWLGVAAPLPEIERLFRVAHLGEEPNFRVFPTMAAVFDSTEYL